MTATNGQVGGFLHTNLAPLLRGNERRVLYVGTSTNAPQGVHPRRLRVDDAGPPGPALRRPADRPGSRPRTWRRSSPPAARRAAPRSRSATTSAPCTRSSTTRRCRPNPVTDARKPEADDTDPDIRFLTEDELEALLRAVPDDHLGPTDRALYLTAALTGLRQGELFALRWRDVDWMASRIRVRRSYARKRAGREAQFGRPKSKRSSRSVPMHDRVGAELERHFQRSHYQADDDLVFCHPHTGGPLDSLQRSQAVQGCARRAGFRPIRFHDLRHTFGTQMAAAGVPMRTLQEWMGHRDIKTTMIYADYHAERARARVGQGGLSGK